MESLKTKSLESLTKAKMGYKLRLALIIAVVCCSTVAAAVLINEGYSSISRSHMGVTQVEFTNSSDDGVEKSVVLSRIQVAPSSNSLDNETEKSVVAIDAHNISMVNSLANDVKESEVASDVNNVSMDVALPEVSSTDGSAQKAMELNNISMVSALPEVSKKDGVIQEVETIAVDNDTTKILFESTDSPITEDDENVATVTNPVDLTDAITTVVYETSTQIDTSVMSDQVSAAQTFKNENASDVIRMEKTEVTTKTINLSMNETDDSVLDLENDMIVSEREGKHITNRKSINNVNNINSDNKEKDEYRNVTLPTNKSTNFEAVTEQNDEPFATLKVIKNESVTSFLNCSNSNSTNVCLFTTNLTSLANDDNEPIKDLELTEQLPNNFLNVSVSVHSPNHTLDFKSFQILSTSDSINTTIFNKLQSSLSTNKTPISSTASVPKNVGQDLEYELMISSVTNNESIKTSDIADSTDFIDYEYDTPMKDIQENTSYSDSYAYDYEYPAIDLSSMLATMNFSNIDFNEFDLSAIDLADLDLSTVDLSVLPSNITLDNFDGSKLPSNLDLSSIDLTSLPKNFTVRGITLNDIEKLNLSNINLEDILSKVNLISTTQSRDTNNKSIATSDVESNLDISTPVAVVTVDREENLDKILDKSIQNFTEKVTGNVIDIPLGTTPTKLSTDEVEHVNVKSTPNHSESGKTISENYRADDGSELSHLEKFLKEATRNLTFLNNLKPEDQKNWVTEEEADLQLIDELGILKLVKMAETVKLDGSGGNLDFMLCVSCKTGVVTAKKLVKELGKDDRTIKALMIYLCISFKLFPSDVCRGTINIAGSELLYVIRRFKHSPAHFCSMAIPEQCKQNPLPAWVPEEPVPTKAPRSLLEGTDFAHLGSPRQPFKKELKILHISDLHLDLEYTEGSAVNCGRPMCCQGPPVRRKSDKTTSTTMTPVAALAKQLITNADDPNNYAAEPPQMSGFRFPTEAGKWGALGGCDLPLRTVRHMLKAAADLKPDLVYMTGDLPAHDIWNQSRTSIQRVLFTTAVEMRRAFPHTPTLYTVGNHEAFPVNSFPVPSVYSKGFRPSWLYDTLATVWPLPRRSLQDVRRGGYYSTSPLPGLRIISVNTNYCNTLNWWLLLDHKDPVDQLSWLAGELSSSREAGQMVHIVTHIPPGNPDCEAIWSRNFAVLMTKYRDIVKGVFTGHQHVDQWQVIHAPGQSKQGTQVPVAMTYVAPAAATFREHSPAFKVFSVDAQDFRMLDYTVYTANLTFANQPGAKPVYEATYSAKQAYQLPDLSPRSWQRLTYQMAANKTLFDTYIRYAHNYWVEPSEVQSCDSRCRRQVLCFLLVGDSSNRKPCAKLPKRFN